MREFSIVIDPGHGGDNEGCHRKDFVEKDFNLLLGRHIWSMLQGLNGKVSLTREGDTGSNLYKRGQFAIEHGADLVLSLHVDMARDADRRGLHCLYRPADLEASMVARIIQRAAPVPLQPSRSAAATPLTYPRACNVMEAYPATMPILLIECGYASNDHDLQYLMQPLSRLRLANTIAGSVFEFCERQIRYGETK